MKNEETKTYGELKKMQEEDNNIIINDGYGMEYDTQDIFICGRWINPENEQMLTYGWICECEVVNEELEIETRKTNKYYDWNSKLSEIMCRNWNSITEAKKEIKSDCIKERLPIPLYTLMKFNNGFIQVEYWKEPDIYS